MKIIARPIAVSAVLAGAVLGLSALPAQAADSPTTSSRTTAVSEDPTDQKDNGSLVDHFFDASYSLFDVLKFPKSE
ncbi:hypothetical protein ABZY09_48435 [Streptomyces sp. NPDC002928]|uniref:hypothetical protein n=1 Tax=Streptomyces sp. NPDC002928 TaxID=3154440 RepID=UPI0033B56451